MATGATSPIGGAQHSLCQGWLLSLKPNSLNDRCDLEQTVGRTTRGFSER